MFVRDGSVFYSASDLTNAVKCEWALMRRLDAKLGRIEAADEIDDPMLARAGVLGGEHEARAFDAYVAEFGMWQPGRAGGVASIEKPEPATDPGALAAAQDATVAALRDGADVVFQGTFFDGGFVGFADFLIKTGDVYEVYDTKLARKARITALLQLAAYAAQLERLGIPLGPDVHLLLGDGSRSTHRRVDIEPVFRDRMERLRWMLDERMAATDPIAWGEPGYTACGRCAECVVQVAATDDVLQVAGMRVTQRARLAEAGIHTLSQLASSTGDVAGIGAAALAKLRAQARMQRDAPEVGLNYEVHDAIGLAALPAPDPGDVFFDFEGDPLWNDGDPAAWGLEYLFGVIEVGDTFRPFWAHTRAEEKQALIAFLEYVRDRRLRYPGMHIYHYADYERSHLQALCARHGVGESILDDLLREHVLVDLYPLVKRSIRVSSASYGLKKLEPLYMGAELRESDVTDGAGSIVAYVDYTLLRDSGRTAEADAQLAEIADYNRYDCVSTLRLRDWLLARADEHGIPRRGDVDPEPGAADVALEREEDVVRDALYAQIEGVPAGSRTADQSAIALAAAAIEYHRREDKTYWWEHFNRHIAPIEEWAEQRGVFVVDEGGAEVVTAWNRPDGRRMDSRVLRLRGRLAPGSRLAPGDHPHLMYDEPLPPACTPAPRGERSEHGRSSVLEVSALTTGLDGDSTEVLLTESTGVGNEPWHELPLALTPPAPIPTTAQRRAILDWGRAIADALPGLPGEPSLDLLRRIPPRLRIGSLAPIGDDTSAAIVDTLLRLDGSYLAVQGPPGSGKTYVGGQVIGDLVRRGWRVGVVAQSHEVVENLLKRVLAGGVPAERVAKRAPSGGYAAAVDWTVLATTDEVAGFVGTHRDQGYVLGGTAWDFSNAAKVPRGELDLLVIDEAGQFSLANTIAVGVSARNLLLLGDPQQLPQVSQGLHPEHVDMSALGWLSDGHDVLPAELGYFLAESWRMHPALCAAVSGLAYEGRLRSREPETLLRRLGGIEPGLHPVPISHDGDAVESEAEAAAVVALVHQHVGLPWSDPELGRVDDMLRPSDIIVVAPYNAQVELIRRLLDEAGLSETPVGTVDRFQGQEAAVAIVSLTASSADDVPRGLSFLLLRNRLNVAISRAKWAAYLVHSPALRDHLPHSAEGLAELSAFIRLTS